MTYMEFDAGLSQLPVSISNFGNGRKRAAADSVFECEAGLHQWSRDTWAGIELRLGAPNGLQKDQFGTDRRRR
jgi:hypothetical protein